MLSLSLTRGDSTPNGDRIELDVLTVAAVQQSIKWPCHPFLRQVGGSEIIRESKMSTMLIESV